MGQKISNALPGHFYSQDDPRSGAVQASPDRALDQVVRQINEISQQLENRLQRLEQMNYRATGPGQVPRSPPLSVSDTPEGFIPMLQHQGNHLQSQLEYMADLLSRLEMIL